MSETYSVALGDINRDGVLDLVCGNTYDGAGNQQNTVYYGLDIRIGAGFVSAPSWTSSPANPTVSVALGDINGDGALDLVCGNVNTSNTLYLNDGRTLRTNPAWSSGPSLYTASVILGDVDGDGDLDLVCGNYYSSNELYINTGGMFETNPAWVSGPANNTACVALGDVDGDGDLDLVCGNANAGNTLYLNVNGTFETTPSWSSGPAAFTTSVQLGDMDGDGDLDLVCGTINAANTMYLNEGGVFGTTPAWVSGVTRQTYSVALGDVDGDGDLDLLCGNLNAQNSLYLNRNGALDATPIDISSPEERTHSVVLGDVDGDGDLDLVCGNAGQSSTLYWNRGAFLETMPSWAAGSNYLTRSVALGDVDGDGDLDLVCGNNGQKNVLYRNNNGTFGLNPVWSSGPNNNTLSIALGDVDGDGDPDLVCGNRYQNKTLYRNIGGTFESTPSWSRGAVYDTRSVALGDVDGDGGLDLVCGNYMSQIDVLYLNTNGTFGLSPVWLSNHQNVTQCVALGDMDGDGDLDLVCGESYFGNLLYLNEGGTFGSGFNWAGFDFYNETNCLALGDVDGDGDLDVACGKGNDVSGYHNSNKLYLNDGGALYSYSWSSGLSDKTGGIAMGDVDNDGDLDLVCGNYDNQSNWLYLNEGGTFEANPSWLSGPKNSTYSIALGDVDNDGDLDLVCGNINANNTLYRGVRAPVLKSSPLSPVNQLPNNGAHIRKMMTDMSNPGYCRIHFTAVDVESDSIFIRPEFQYEGFISWGSLIDSRIIKSVGPFATSPAGVRDSIDWDTHLLAFDRRNVIIRFRVIEIPKRVSTIQHVAPYFKNIGPVAPYRPLIAAADMLSFSAVTLGDTTSAALNVANQGTDNLTITDIEFPTADMYLVDALPIQVAPKAATNLTIVWAPGSEAAIQDDLIIHSDDPYSPSTIVDLSAVVRPLDFTLANLYPGGEIDQGTAAGISITMRDYVRVDSARVIYRAGGAPSFGSLRLQRLDDPVNEQYFGSIPAASIKARGVEYFVEVYNDRFSSAGSIRHLRTRVKNLDFSALPPVERYGMISLPLEMEGPILGVLSDDLGGQDNTQWRLWEYDRAATAYTEVPNDTITHFQLGRGYWLITKTAHTIDTGPAEGLSTPTDAPFEITLNPGWNMLGDPFAFPVAWSSVEVDTFTMAEAVEQGVIEPLWRWNASAGAYEQNVTVVEPFEAYWMMNSTDPARQIVLSVPPAEWETGAVPAATTAAKENSGNWEVALRVTCGDIVTGHSVVGVNMQASALRDPFDRSEPPMNPGRSVSLYVPHFEWEHHAGRYAVDMRAPGNEEVAGQAIASISPSRAAGENDWGHRWLFDVAKNFSDGAAGDEIALEFSGIQMLPQDLQIILVDRALARVVDLRKENRYEFYQGKRDFVTRDDDARFLLLAGSDAFVESYEQDLPQLPTETVLHQNHPNPFNPSTIIRYELASAGRVRVKIYSVSGALVKTVEDRHREPGRYEVGWDGLNERGEQVSSGVYFYVLEAPGVRLAKKMMCVK